MSTLDTSDSGSVHATDNSSSAAQNVPQPVSLDHSLAPNDYVDPNVDFSALNSPTLPVALPFGATIPVLEENDDRVSADIGNFSSLRLTEDQRYALNRSMMF